MELLPETTLGNFFNRQHREAGTFQFIESLSGTSQGAGGLHLYKAGIDLLHSRYSSTSASRSVLIRRTDGTLARRLDFGPPRPPSPKTAPTWPSTRRTVCSPASGGMRNSAPGSTATACSGNYNLTPRVGAAFLLNKYGTSVLRSGYGLFFERTPSVAGVFNAVRVGSGHAVRRRRHHAARSATIGLRTSSSPTFARRGASHGTWPSITASIRRLGGTCRRDRPAAARSELLVSRRP